MRTSHGVLTDLFIGLLVLGLGSFMAHAVSMDMVTVGDLGNTADTTGTPNPCGAVAYEYRIGTYEVTAGQYTEFLNAVAATDTYGLYSTLMWTSTQGCKIQRSGSPGSYTYTVASDYADRPVNNVSWGDAARFVNWLHNGQPTGAQGPATTEDGAYTLSGAMSDAALAAVARNAAATWWVPTENEWYKAAYHKNDGVTGNYWDYPTGTNSAPGRDMTEVTNPGNNANYYAASPYPIDGAYYTTKKGEFELSSSPYGTFDQAGNVFEWNEASGPSQRCRRGSGWGSSAVSAMSVSARTMAAPTAEQSDIGFRVAAPPPLQHYPVTMAVTLVDNRSNAADTTGQPNPCGAVAYGYRIGTYEVSAAQYTEFLNAVAATDTYGLYNSGMLTFANCCKIQQNGVSGGYWYTVPSTHADRPVTVVSWGDAARFANWMHNGMPTGAQGLSTTEDGAYYLNGANDDTALSAVTRKADATWWIPSESEWYKAAYHKNDGATGNYWDYPTGSDTAPTTTSGGTTAGTTVFNQPLPADVDYCGGLSPHGTMGQGGNVYEWNEANTGTKRNRRGGSFGGGNAAAQKVDVRYDEFPTFQQSDVGFRVASYDPPRGTTITIR